MSKLKLNTNNTYKKTEPHSKEFIKQISKENDIFNFNPKNMEELKKYVDTVLNINVLKNANLHYLSLGVSQLVNIIDVSKKTIFDMIKSNQLDSIKIGKYRLLIFCIEEYCEYSVKDVKKMIKLPPLDIGFKLDCKLDKASLVKAILFKYEHSLK